MKGFIIIGNVLINADAVAYLMLVNQYKNLGECRFYFKGHAKWIFHELYDRQTYENAKQIYEAGSFPVYAKYENTKYHKNTEIIAALMCNDTSCIVQYTNSSLSKNFYKREKDGYDELKAYYDSHIHIHMKQ